MSETKYKNYKFKVEEVINPKSLEAYHAVQVYNKKIDDETLLLSLNGGGSFSLYLQDRFFNFNIDDETKRISSFEGNLTYSKIKIIKLKLPTIIKEAILNLNTEDFLNKGMGSYIEFNTSDVLYDKEQGILQIGNINPNDITYKFFKNAYTQIQDGNLTGLMFTDLEL